MWSKIKGFPVPISIKLTFLYTAILSLILLFTSSLTVAGLYYVLYDQAVADIDLSVDTLSRHIASGEPVDQRLLKENLLLPGIILRISDEQNHLLVDSAPHMLSNQAVVEKAEIEHDPLNPALLLNTPLRILHLNDMYFYYATTHVSYNSHTYQLQIIKTMAAEKSFLKTLIQGLFLTTALGLLIAILAGMFISRKTLQPLRTIITTAKEIEINDLGKRIPLSSSKDELHELAATFNHMLNRIQTGFEQQQRFVADASHELRTPITVISGYADMLDRWGKQDGAALTEGIEAIKSEAANMHNLIEKLLFLARTDQNKQILTKEALSMQPLLEEIFQETCLIASQHQVLLTENQPASILADAAALKQMLRIFIENSIKYTPDDGCITLASQKINNHLEITITDTGIGIPEKEQAKIFDRFYRVDSSRSKTTGGTGLGLSIAHWIAAQHDAAIHVASVPGQGTTITLRFPVVS
ncbi:ATP-binding protein [uncultured Anaeromusa sp.]|uniref:sensor histidine kinase n=1 Tax=uncultured Anaeromusa sp. TaxID=673273 RepID=UPI0029C8BE33|nr:ATP-binding protein [uncultured Anaeromusa sp.]